MDFRSKREKLLHLAKDQEGTPEGELAAHLATQLEEERPNHFLSSWKLDENKNPVPIYDDDQEAIKVAFNIENRLVERTEIPGGYVSTVFLVIDHSFGFGHHDLPVLFETMVFDEKGAEGHNHFQTRYCTWAQAVEGHKQTVVHCLACTDEDCDWYPTAGRLEV